MKRICITLALCMGFAASATAQEVTYALPSTTLSIRVETRQESFFAGPYAAYAKKLLNMEVREHDAVTTAITAVELVPQVEADPKALFTCEAENASLMALTAQGLVALQNKADAVSMNWRFLPALQADFGSRGITAPDKKETRISYKTLQTDTATVNIPIEHKVKVAKSLEDKAADAADMILAVRKDRLNIVSGNTDANYSGEAMNAALRELDRIEEEYLALFRGYSVVRTNSYSFDVRPDAETRVHRYLAFRLTDDGPVSDGIKGVPYYIELEPETMEFPEDEERRAKGRATSVRYRIPCVCKVYLTRDGRRILETRVPVFQLGIDALLYQYR